MRKEMPNDPFDMGDASHIEEEHANNEDIVTTIGTSTDWTNFRANLANEMFDAWIPSRNEPY